MQLSDFLRKSNSILRYTFKELPRGIDFSLSELSNLTEEGYHGYGLSPKKTLKNILKEINIYKKKFLDIGSGKGGVICFAYELGAKSRTGLENVKKLH